MTDEKQNPNTMSRAELIEKLRARMDKDGYFTLKNVDDKPEAVPDPSLTREERINQAIEAFENSLEKPHTSTRVLIIG